MTVEGDRDVLGLWFQETEGAKFWMQVLTDLKRRGVRGTVICCPDRVKGFFGGDRRDIPEHDRPNSRCPPHPSLADLRAPAASASKSLAT
jgi:hypothetical protein